MPRKRRSLIRRAVTDAEIRLIAKLAAAWKSEQKHLTTYELRRAMRYMRERFCGSTIEHA